MDPEYPEYYSREQQYNQSLFGEFVQQHAKVSARFGALPSGETADPYVERLLQSSAFINARTQMSIDRATDPYTLRQLQCIHPNYVAPLPSMAVVQFHPAHRTGQGAVGLTLPQGSQLMSRAEEGHTACEFRTAFAVTVLPLEISHFAAGGIPPDIPDLHRYVFSNARVRASLRLRIRTTNGASISTLRGLDRLPVYLRGPEAVASRLFELIHTATLSTVTAAPGQFATSDLHCVFQDGFWNGLQQRAVDYEGMEPEHSLLQPVHAHYHGHNLLHEQFAFAPRFWFFTLSGLAPGLSGIDGPEAEIVLLLGREPGELAQHIEVSQAALFCVPVVNLFKVHSEKLTIEPLEREHRLIPFVDNPDDYVIHSVDQVTGKVEDEESAPELRFDPIDVALPDDERPDRRYFTVRRELDAPAHNTRIYSTRQPHVRTHTWLSLLGHDRQRDDSGVRYLRLHAWLTNGDLPCTLPVNGIDDLEARDVKAIATIGFVRAPTTPRPPLANSHTAWRLVQQMKLEDGTFDDEYDEPDPGAGLRMLLWPYRGAGAPAMGQQLDGLVGAGAKAIYADHRVDDGRPNGNMMFMRGAAITLTFDERLFDGGSPFTLALALERYVARHVSQHAFTRTTYCTQQRGPIFTWPTRDGTRGVL
jgi:type VI secretion system protein ImpG